MPVIFSKNNKLQATSVQSADTDRFCCFVLVPAYKMYTFIVGTSIAMHAREPSSVGTLSSLVKQGLKYEEDI